MVAALLAPGTSVLKNVPEIRDVHVVSDLLRLHGVDVDVQRRQGHRDHQRLPCRVCRPWPTSTRLPGPPVSRSCSPGPLLHRLGEAFIPALGGCNIGGRPIDFHLRNPAQARRRCGQGSRRRHPHHRAERTEGREDPSACTRRSAPPSRTLLAAVLGRGARLNCPGAATEPEIMDLVAVLQKMGAIISVDVDRTLSASKASRSSRLHAHLADRPHRSRTAGRPPRLPLTATSSSRAPPSRR